MISADGVAKVADFGIAKALGATQITKTGTVKGKMGYMAPELLEGLEASVESDVFALAATLYRLFSGVAPFQGNNQVHLMRAVLTATPPSLATLRPGIPEPVTQWIMQALEKRQEVRPTLRELLAVIDPSDADRRVLSACVQMTRSSTSAEAEREPTRRTAAVRAPAPRRAWALALFAMMAASAGAAVTLSWKSVFARAPTPAAPPTPAVAVAPTPVAPPPVQVEEQTPAPVTPAPPAKPVEPTVVRSKPNTQPAKRPLKAPVTARPAPVPAVSKGRLQVKVRPWAQVFVDGEPKGVTPMEAFALPSGQHSVILVNPDLKTQRTYRVSIEEGKQAELKAVLDEPPPP